MTLKRHLSAITAATLALAGIAACSSGQATHSANASPPAAPKGGRAWLASAHQANLAEIEIGELAMRRSSR